MPSTILDRRPRAAHAAHKIIPLAAALFFFLVVPVAFSQDLIGEAQTAFSQGDYKKAAGSAQEYLTRTKDTTSPLAMEANFYIAFFEYSQGNFEKAMPTFQAMADPKAAALGMREQGVFYLSDANMRLGDSLASKTDDESKKKRAAAYDAADKGFRQYLQDFREGVMRNEAYFGLAKTYTGMERFKDAFAVLDSLIKALSRPNVSLAEVSVLVQCYSLKASASKAYRDVLIAEKKADDAERLLTDIKKDIIEFFKKQTDPSISNEVAFTIGDMLASLTNYTDSIEFYRYIKPKDEIIKALDSRIARLIDEWRRALVLAGANKDAQNRVNAYYGPIVERVKETRKDIETKGDPILMAMERMVYCYFGMKRYHEANILTRHLGQFRKPEEKIAGLKLSVFAAVGAHSPETAAQLLQELEAEKEFKKGDPELENVAHFIAKLYEVEGKHPKALEYYEKSANDYPDGPNKLQNLMRAGIVLFRLERYRDALGKFNDYETAIGDLTEEYWYFRGKTHYELGEWVNCVDNLREINNRHPDFPLRSDVVYTLADSYTKMRRPKDAATVLKDYLDEPRSQGIPYRPNLLYQLGFAYKQLMQAEDAVKAFQEIVRIGNNLLVPFAQLEIAKSYAKDKPKMEAELKKLIGLRDVPPRILAEARFLLGASYQQDKKWDDAIAEFQALVDKFPEDARAPEAVVNIAAAQYSRVKDVREPGKLEGEKRDEWLKAVQSAVDTYITLLKNYAASPHSEGALTFLSQITALKVAENLMTLKDAEAFFRQLAQRQFAGNPAIQGRLLFALGNTYIQLSAPDKATREAEMLKIYNEAYALSKEAPGSVVSYTQYGSLLLDNNQLDRATELFTQMLDEKFVNPREQLEGPIEANWWLGHIHFIKKEWDKADEYLKKVLDAPWSPRFTEATFEMATIAESKARTIEELEAARKQFESVLQLQASTTTKAKSYLRVSYIYKAQSALAKPPEDKKARASAITTFKYLAVYFERENLICSEAFYQAGMLLELERDKDSRDGAIECYQKSIARAPASEWAQKSRARLQQLGAPEQAKQP